MQPESNNRRALDIVNGAYDFHFGAFVAISLSFICGLAFGFFVAFLAGWIGP